MLRALLSLVVALLLALPLGAWLFMYLSLPPNAGLVTIPALQRPVIVNIDARGVPYVQAASDSDAYLAQGYLVARDRLFQMEMLRRAALGQLSEIFGPATLPQDKLARTLGFAQLAQEELTKLSPPARNSLDSYSQGVNAYLAASGSTLPIEFRLLAFSPRPWAASDSLAILRYLSYQQDESWKLDDLRQRLADKLGDKGISELFEEDWPDTPVLVGAGSTARLKLPTLPGADPSPPGSGSAARTGDACPGQRLSRQLASLPSLSWPLSQPAPGAGSTAMAVAGRLAASGGSLMALDKHGPLTAPDLYYICSLSSPELHVAGATIPGVPGIMFGRNAHIAFGSASLKADVQDLFLEQFSAQFTRQYRTPSGWADAAEKTEIIPVRFTRDVVHKVLITRHGPVLIKDGTTAVALAWTGHKVEGSPLNALWKLNRARNWEEFSQALEAFEGPAQLFVFADRYANIGWRAAAKIPVRSAGGQGTALVPGWTGKGDWVGEVADSDLPFALNPAKGFIVGANQKFVGRAYPWLIGHQWAAPYRAFRAQTVLAGYQKQGRHVGLPDLNELQVDELSAMSDLVKRELKESIVRSELIDQIQLAAFDLLERWDGKLAPESPAATIYESFLRTLAQRLIASRIGPELGSQYLKQWHLWPLYVERYLRERPRDRLPEEERTHETFMLTTFSQALKGIRVALRDDRPSAWPWRALHTAVFRHVVSQGAPWLAPLFDIGPVGVGGDEMSLNGFAVTAGPGPGAFPCQSGPIMRLIVDMADQDRFYQAISLGQSGLMLSPFQRNQLAAWLKADPAPVAFSGTQLERQTQSKLVLSPRSTGDNAQ